MPKTIAQWTALAVTTIIVFGRDLDVVYALPMGMLAGSLAMLFAMLDDQRRKAAVLARIASRNRRA